MSLTQVACPQCGKKSPWDTANRFRPFCGERCKMIDMGAWASESYRVPVTEVTEDLLDESLESASQDHAQKR